MPTAPCDRDKGEEGGRAEGCVGREARRMPKGATKEIPKRSFKLKTDIHSLTKKKKQVGEYHQSIEVPISRSRV